MRTILRVALIVVAAGCSKKEDGGGKAAGDQAPGGGAPAGGAAPAPAACPPLTFTIDGEAQTGFVHALAIQHKDKYESVWQVEMYSHDQVTCEQVLSKGGRAAPAGERNVRAYTGDRTKGVGFGGHAQMRTADVRVVGAPPAQPGDTLTLCADEHAFTRDDGTKVIIAGTFTGTYCGVLEF
jgi:hypothetical protein